MSDYITKTASLKATTIDARKIDTKKLFINGELFDPTNVGKVKRLEITWADGYWSDDNDGYWGYEMTNDVYYSGGEWYPLSIYINGNEVCCKKE